MSSSSRLSSSTSGSDGGGLGPTTHESTFQVGGSAGSSSPRDGSDSAPVINGIKSSNFFTEDGGGGGGSFFLTSTFHHNGEMSKVHHQLHGNKAPPLSWDGAPDGTRSFVLIVEDREAEHPDDSDKTTHAVHWLVYNIPGDVTEMSGGSLPRGAKEGINSFRETSYVGPYPREGKHRYLFRLFAIDLAKMSLKKPRKGDIYANMAGHVLGETELAGFMRARGSPGGSTAAGYAPSGSSSQISSSSSGGGQSGGQSGGSNRTSDALQSHCGGGSSLPSGELSHLAGSEDAASLSSDISPSGSLSYQVHSTSAGLLDGGGDGDGGEDGDGDVGGDGGNTSNTSSIGILAVTDNSSSSISAGSQPPVASSTSTSSLQVSSSPPPPPTPKKKKKKKKRKAKGKAAGKSKATETGKKSKRKRRRDTDPDSERKAKDKSKRRKGKRRRPIEVSDPPESNGFDSSRQLGLSGGGSLGKPRGYAREYADVNDSFPKKRFQISKHKIVWGSSDQYKLHDDKMVGRGAYGEVYLTTDTETNEVCVAKTMKPEKADKNKIQREIHMLTLVKGGPFIIELLDVVKNPKTKISMLIFEYVENPDYKKVFPRMGDEAAREYLFKTLSALHWAHSQGIIHRDFKAGNVLYNPKTRDVRLIDWGFGQFYWKNKRTIKWPGTRSYKAPELFLHYDKYDYAVDVWAWACVMGALVFDISHMFKGTDGTNDSQMDAIGYVLGKQDFFAYKKRYGFRDSKVSGFSFTLWPKKRVALRTYKRKDNRHKAVDEAVEILEAALVWDHEERATAREILASPYFDPVRNGSSSSSSGGGGGDAGASSSASLYSS